MKEQKSHPESVDLAGEYVLGTMSAQQREAFERRLAADYELQQEVEAWQNRLSPMLDAIEPVTPPVDVWRSIQIRIAAQDDSAAHRGLWNSLVFWRGMSVAAVGLVLVLSLGLLGLLRTGGELQQIMVVTNDRAQTGWIVGATGRSSLLRVSAVEPTQLPPGKVCQLWLETEDGRLLPMGILPHSGIIEMRIPSGAGRASRFKVSIESAEQAPVAQPAADFVFEGRLRTI